MDPAVLESMFTFRNRDSSFIFSIFVQEAIGFRKIEWQTFRTLRRLEPIFLNFLNFFSIFEKLVWNFFEASLKLFWNFVETFLTLFKIFLKFNNF